MLTTPVSKIVIAIDGHSSTGKSSFAKAIAAKAGYVYVDSGAMYRAVTLYGLQYGLISNDGKINTAALIAALPDIRIEFRNIDGQNVTFLQGVNVEHDIRGIRVSRQVSAVSAIAEVRTHLVHLQQLMGKDKGIVMDGRDIGTVVFPQAELKIFMTADPRVRAERRHRELVAKGGQVSLDETLRHILQRDYIDEHRAVTPLRKAGDALLLDNSHLTPADQMKWFEEIWEKYK
ncbi:MAG: (d)CMP kinase [Prevotellaceae bacterium]|nr:(d)CMP kinase [Prevotellaceae bacterium]